MVKQFKKIKGEHRDAHTDRVTDEEKAGDYEYSQGAEYSSL